MCEGGTGGAERFPDPPARCIVSGYNPSETPERDVTKALETLKVVSPGSSAGAPLCVRFLAEIGYARREIDGLRRDGIM
jgi:hypothetical protein